VFAVVGLSNDTDFSIAGTLLADGGFIVAGSNDIELYTTQ